MVHAVTSMACTLASVALAVTGMACTLIRVVRVCSVSLLVTTLIPSLGAVVWVRLVLRGSLTLVVFLVKLVCHCVLVHSNFHLPMDG